MRYTAVATKSRQTDLQLAVLRERYGKMATFTLNVYTAESIFDQNDHQDGFVFMTSVVQGQRTYRITRTITNGITTEDFFDFTLDTSGEIPGSMTIRNIPYMPILFSTIPTSQAIPIGNGTKFNGEKFDILFITPTVNSDPIRETPSYINTSATFTVAGAPRPIKFIYYSLIDGVPVYRSFLGHKPFSDQYDTNFDLSQIVDTTKTFTLYTNNDIDYYIMRISTTPNVIVTNGTPKVPGITGLSDTYTIGGITYTLTASSGGTQTWESTVGTKTNGFYVDLAMSDTTTGERSFDIQPADSIQSVKVVALSNTKYKFLIVPKIGIESMDLKILLASK